MEGQRHPGQAAFISDKLTHPPSCCKGDAAAVMLSGKSPSILYTRTHTHAHKHNSSYANAHTPAHKIANKHTGFKSVNFEIVAGPEDPFPRYTRTRIHINRRMLPIVIVRFENRGLRPSCAPKPLVDGAMDPTVAGSCFPAFPWIHRVFLAYHSK